MSGQMSMTPFNNKKKKIKINFKTCSSLHKHSEKRFVNKQSLVSSRGSLDR